MNSLDATYIQKMVENQGHTAFVLVARLRHWLMKKEINAISFVVR
jgi:hypothetical protein